MFLKDFKFTDGNYFVAMQYHTLILNRTFLVINRDDFLLGLKVNGYIGADSGYHSSYASVLIDDALAVHGDLDNPFTYVKTRYMNRYLDEDINTDSILGRDDNNFKIYKRDIVDVAYDSSKKWGMGNYPHDGKVYVTTSDGNKREFIILGKQSGSAIAGWIRGHGQIKPLKK